ncbi:ABC transporter substrate-binding protein [Mycetocola spongiae]|uniref:ABC transporter substrate-binding protein n=1 Tax=Mycetocola spongiae TaxID=2859226 RepID=UPI00384E87EA|nr:ABC transporter substrate-binding protein [Mycetocola spongiae]
MNTASTVRRLALPVLAAGLALGLLSCAQTTPGNTAPAGGGTLTYASGDAEPTCLDPHVGGNYPQSLLAAQFLEQLVTLDKNGAAVPWLASAWTESEDGLTWTFTVREGVSFSDGTPLNAAAVVRNIEHVQDPATKSSTGYLALGKVTAAAASDEHTVTLTLSEPDSALLESLSMPWLAIESPAGLDRSQEENCQTPVGTGAFIVSEWKRQDRVVLTRNTGYNSAPEGAASAAPALADTLNWRFIPDAATRYAALQSGDVQIIDNAQPDNIVAAGNTQGLGHLDAPRPGSVNRIEFNSSRGPLSDIRVREALIRAVDLDAGIKTLFFGTAERSYSPLSSVEPLGLTDKAPFGHDAAAANELLSAAGWSEPSAANPIRMRDGEKLSLAFPVSTNQSIPAEQSLFEQIQAQARTVGIEITLEPTDLSTWYERLGANEYDLVSAPYTKVGPDVLRILYHSSGITPAPSGYFANHAQINDPALDELLTRGSEITAEDERADLYRRAQQIVLDGYYILPLYDQQNHFLYSEKLDGMGETNSVGNPLLRSVAPTR